METPKNNHQLPEVSCSSDKLVAALTCLNSCSTLCSPLISNLHIRNKDFELKENLNYPNPIEISEIL